MLTIRCVNTGGQKCHAKGSRKEIKWKNSYVEIKRMGSMKCVTVPVIIGANGVVTKVCRKTGKS